jgi:hypothetical protein
MAAKRTVCTAYYNHKGQRLKLPHSNLSANPNGACMRAFFHMTANTYAAKTCQVYDIETAELYAEFRTRLVKGELVVEATVKFEARNFGDPIRRTSAHALFHELELEAAV